MTTPRVSILIPAFDAATTLATCLRSVLRQGERDWECVVVDDGSRDDTLALASSFADRDSRFRAVAKTHGGIVSALNAGLESCRAPVIARMDADDWMHRDRLAAQLHFLDARQDHVAVGCHVRFFPRRALREGLRAYERWICAIRDEDDVRREAFVECPIAHPTLAIRRATLRCFGYRDRGWPEDYDLILRMLAADRAIGVVDRRLLAWRDPPGGTPRTGDAYRLESFTECKAEHLASSFLAKDREYVLWGYGDTGRSLRRALALRGRTPCHIVELHPRRLGQRIHGAPVVHPRALPGLPRRPIVVAVAGAGPRGQVRAALARMGFRELADFVCAA